MSDGEQAEHLSLLRVQVQHVEQDASETVRHGSCRLPTMTSAYVTEFPSVTQLNCFHTSQTQSMHVQQCFLPPQKDKVNHIKLAIQRVSRKSITDGLMADVGPAPATNSLQPDNLAALVRMLTDTIATLLMLKVLPHLPQLHDKHPLTKQFSFLLCC